MRAQKAVAVHDEGRPEAQEELQGESDHAEAEEQHAVAVYRE